jgi:tetratricopeptide (TPR) repeat protein
MAKIPLRAYYKDIEALIEQGEIDQAVAHARNILKKYPKNIETYRLLGKAFLESQRYSDAADILQRVLSVIPDDFISHIGMSIIREDENNLDAAIWHMERAYEVQPFNPAVQDELRRLFSRRDGVEPPKIRLTRGALVRMYARGELFPQAIAETRAALAEDPQRLDLRVLLARLYFYSGHKNDAAEVCSELISKLPFCYEANRLLSEILPTTSRAEEAKKFRQRLIALDPYEAYTSPAASLSSMVPDQTVLVETLLGEAETEEANLAGINEITNSSWDASSVEELPDWLNTLSTETIAEPGLPEEAHSPVETVTLPDEENTIPISTEELEPLVEQSEPEISVQPAVTETTEEVQPEGMVQLESAETEILASEPGESLSSSVETVEPAPVEATEQIPEFLTDAGWQFTEKPAEEINAQPENTPADEVLPAEIPEWLQSLAPNGAKIYPDAEGMEATLDEEVEPTIASYSTEETDSGLPSVTEIKEAIVPNPELEESSIPEPLSAMDSPSEEIQAENAPDQDMPLSAEPLAEDGNAIPDWLSLLQEKTAQDQPAAVDPFEPAEEAQDLFPANTETTEGGSESSSELPDWLTELDQETAISSEDQAEVEERLEQLSGFTRNPVEPVAESEAESVASSEAASIEDVTLSVSTSEETLNTIPEAQETAVKDDPASIITDDAVSTESESWLEDLFAQQEAQQAATPTLSSEPTIELPDWMKKEFESQTFSNPSVETSESSFPSNPDEGAWPVDQEKVEAENRSIPAENLVSEEENSMMDWLKQLEDQQQDESIFTEPPAPVPDEFHAAWKQEIETVEEEASILSPIAEPETTVLVDSAGENQPTAQPEDLDQVTNRLVDLVSKGQLIEGTIQEIQSALELHPESSRLWQVLGDAYAKNNQLQKALDAYTKAEENIK